MAKIVLIHGFAAGIQFSFFRNARGKDVGFGVFAKDIENKNATVFRWAISERASFFQTINPFYTANVYNHERARIQDTSWQKKLAMFLEKEKPEMILCHSLGSRFLLETANVFGLPDAVSHVIFIQGDVPKSFNLTHKDLLRRVKNNTLYFLNVYCPWDPSLFVSSIFHATIRFGQFPIKKDWLKNKFFALTHLPNPHMSALFSKKFYQWTKTLL